MGSQIFRVPSSKRQRESNFKTREQTKEKRGQFTLVVGGLLVIALVVPMAQYGTMETMPHNSVHGWTGNQAQVGKKDMGTLYAAGRDSVFYTRHANLDRQWEVWKSLGNEDIDDTDYLNSEFIFYNENAELVKMKVKDSFDATKLDYTYADAENLWLNQTTSRLSDVAAKLSGSDRVCVMSEAVTEPCSMVLSRDKENAMTREEMLVIERIERVLRLSLTCQRRAIPPQ